MEVTSRPSWELVVVLPRVASIWTMPAWNQMELLRPWLTRMWVRLVGWSLLRKLWGELMPPMAGAQWLPNCRSMMLSSARLEQGKKETQEIP